MTKVFAIQDSSDYRPEGAGYAPQVVLTSDSPRRGWNITELNTDYLPFTGEELERAYSEFRSRSNSFSIAENMVVRWARALGVTSGTWVETKGFGQGDYGVSFVFSTSEWMETTGAVNLSKEDHNDLCAWIWGDVYEVWEEGNEYPTVVYGMDNAWSYGAIEF